tara:strand:+ start:126 stop:398 length:273 start_codon:yes stop_codon:yes gene_type:complete
VQGSCLSPTFLTTAEDASSAGQGSMSFLNFQDNWLKAGLWQLWGFYKRARRKIITNPVKIALIIINKPGQSTIGSSYLGTRGSIYSLGGS